MPQINLLVLKQVYSSKVRWREHCSTKKTSEVGGHLLLNPGHTVNWEILTKTPKQVYERMILEAFYIWTIQPTLNNQLDTKRFIQKR